MNVHLHILGSDGMLANKVQLINGTSQNERLKNSTSPKWYITKQYHHKTVQLKHNMSLRTVLVRYNVISILQGKKKIIINILMRSGLVGTRAAATLPSL
jgi:hypothetical protein